MSFLTDRRRAQGLGSAKEGVHHWRVQRVSAVALVPLAVLFVFPFVQTLGLPHDAVLARYRHPFHAIVAMLFIGTALYHLRLGLQVVIEDYVPAHGTRALLLLASTLLAWAAGLTGVFAVAKIALGQ
jgi:succinate dehydrogenase / fumarate reductase membrane anchor subunit